MFLKKADFPKLRIKFVKIWKGKFVTQFCTYTHVPLTIIFILMRKKKTSVTGAMCKIHQISSDSPT